MSSPISSLKKGKKAPLSPGHRNVPFRPVQVTDDDVLSRLTSMSESTEDTNCSAESSSTNISKTSKPNRNTSNATSKGQKPVSMKKNSSSSAPNDIQLLSSMMARLAKAEAKLNEAAAENNEKDKRIRILEEKCELYQKARGYGDEHLEELESKCRQLQKQVHDMERFLEDYGMIWVGETDNSDGDLELDDETLDTNHEQSTSVWMPGSSLSASTQFQVDFDLVLHNIQELNSISGAGEHFIKHTKDGARLQVKEPIPITLYKNGIFMFGGPFRPYSDKTTQICMIDFMEGYFPTELQSRYPDGVPFMVKDMRNTTYKDRRREKLFPGEGQVLSPEKERSPSHVNQSQLHKSTQLKEMIDEVDNPPEIHRITAEQFLNKLPVNVVKQGKIIDVRSEISSQLKDKSSANQIVVIETKAVQQMKNRMATHKKVRPPTPSNIATLRVKSETGDQTYVLKMKFSETIGDLRRYLDGTRGKDAPPYSLKTPFPNKTYNDLNSTLSENNLTPNATLHIVPRKL